MRTAWALAVLAQEQPASVGYLPVMAGELPLRQAMHLGQRLDVLALCFRE